MKVLFVSRSFPTDLRTAVSGTFQRLAMFVEALGGVADVEMLFYVRPGTDVSPSAVSAVERALCSRWSTPVRLFLCSEAEPKESSSRWRLYVKPALSFFHQYSETSGNQQVGAFEACLARQPDA